MRFVSSSARAGGECVFCRLPDGDERHLLHRSEHVYTVLNLYPYTTGHVLVIPRRHVSRLAELRQVEWSALTAEVSRAERILRRKLGAELIHVGFNLGRAAGAGIDGHLHAHLVPREAGSPGPEGPDLDRVHAHLAPAFAAEAP
jgi:ATP adenylyltransferase